ncbi:MAG: type III-A CRISPR-associated RAMP protein Csm3 [Anaerolineae bacterium]|nr:type III-A CRISPR-associated RAMP protein Csm3 [Anaerolineae bacterium]MDW8098090.1 type III-A CRISPR-associated RAMP protein Csm3 [Anaerolineae bacterium]
MPKQIQLKGRIFLTFNIQAVTGLHIGGSETGIEIGGVDKVVIRDPITNRPYIPGSSLKGKMRSLLEKYRGLSLNRNIGGTAIHSCDQSEEYQQCDICQVFGVPGEMNFATPTRLVVRDVHLTDESARILTEQAHTDLPYTEVKTEVSIDRVTSAANPRRMERVPAGAIFGPAELVYSVYEGKDGYASIADPKKDVERFRALVEGLQLLEDDYLGGSGSRGSGKVRLQGIRVSVRSGEKKYLEAPQKVKEYDDLSALESDLLNLLREVTSVLGLA